MKRLLRTALVARSIAGLLSGQGAIQPVPPARRVATRRAFTPQTLYFMSSTGSDGANDLVLGCCLGHA